MKKLITLLTFVAATAVTPLFAHAGHAHMYFGAVTAVHAEQSTFTMKTREGAEMTVQTSPQTAYLDQDGKAAKASDLGIGARVAVTTKEDGKTAATIRMAKPAAEKATAEKKQ